MHLVDGDPARKVAEFDAWHTALRGLEPGDVIAQHVSWTLPKTPRPKPTTCWWASIRRRTGSGWTTAQDGATRDYAVAGTVEVTP